MFITKLKQALSKLTRLFAQTQGAKIETLEEILLEADVGVKYTRLIIDKIKTVAEPVSELKKEIFKLINLPNPIIETTPPLVIMISGVNGSGKTTTVAKLAYRYSQKGKVLLASADTYRDAAREQLQIWAERANVEMVGAQKGQDAASVVYDALSKAQIKKTDTVLIDTAGRLHTRTDLIEELKKIVRVIKKFKPNSADHNLLTIDASLGQNSIQQARVFTQALGINGIVLTKFDGTAKGGAIIPICNELKIPVLYLGIGEDLEDLIEFKAEEFVETIFEP